jgi:hypothetical protein
VVDTVVATFVERIAAAWLDAACFADTRATAVQGNKTKKDIYEFWDHRADRYEAQAKSVSELRPASLYNPVAKV